MNEAFVEINGVLTKVTTWGRWIEESQGDTDEIIIIIPGNPGGTGFYKVFGKTIYEKLGIPVWCVGHAGHNFSEKTTTAFPKFNDYKDLYGLKGQVEHKADFFKKYVPQDAKVHLIGHSIGSYMILEILEHSEVKDKIEDVYLLFPTIEAMAESRSGQFLINWIKPIVWLTLLFTWVFSMLPNIISTFMLYIYMFIANVPRRVHTENIRELLKPGILKRVFFLAFEEMDQVRERNNDVIKRNKNLIKFYYGKNDGWTWPNYWNKLNSDIPDVNFETTNTNHAFVFNCSVDVAYTVVDWIRARK